MIIAVSGSRHLTDYICVKYVLKEHLNRMTKVITGECRGTDQLAKRFAKHYGVEHKEIAAEWSRYDKRAGPLRNEELVRRADIVIVFWDGKVAHSGSLDVIRKTITAKKELHVYMVEPKENE